jgi:tRNA A-37 threonylcarbamoyl transferase component Bud32
MLTQVGKYQIVEKIGVGGFGTVYKGRDPFIKRLVAIKTCQSDEEEIKKRFFREAEFAGNLHHPNVTTIYDFGVTEDGTPYIVQEFLTGEDLDKLIKKHVPLSLHRKVRILVDVCEGLGYAHAAGIIHRDIKPSNIRILDDGTVKIMDFGIAKSLVSPSTLTQTGITLGTASYLAPEQIRGETLDARTDIFSLGVVAYEILTGQKPFTGDHISTVLYKIMNETPPRAGEFDPAVPAALDQIVHHALEKDRGHRYASCGELKKDLAATLKQIPDEVPTLPTSQRPVLDVEKTLATPSSGFSRAGAAAAAGVTPATGISGAAPARAAVPESVGDVHLRAGSDVPPARPAAPERNRALGIFAAAAALLVAVGVVGWFALRGGKDSASPVRPVPPTPAAAVPAAPASTSAPAPAAPPTPEAAPTPAPAAEPTRDPDAPMTVTFESNSNAQLTVDGKSYRGLPAPVRVSLKPGKHVAVFEIPNYQKKTESFEVRPGVAPASVRVNFPPWGILDVGSDPPGAEIRIDGAAIGTTPLKKPFPVGTHAIELVLPGYEPAADSRVVSELESTKAFFRLKKTP